MRVSENMRFGQIAGRVNQARSDHSQALEKVASQKRINKLSDDPMGAVQMIRDRSAIANLQQHQKNSEHANDFLRKSEVAISELSNHVIRARELAVAMSNDTYGAVDRNATAKEVDQIMERVINLGNSSFNGRYVFGGFSDQNPPVTKDGNYVGDSGDILIQSSQGVFKKINFTAEDLFNPSSEHSQMGHADLITALKSFKEGLVTNDGDMIQSSLGDLSYQTEKVSSLQASVGAIQNSLTNNIEALKDDEILAKTRLAKVEEVDMVSAASDLKKTESVLQASLTAGAKLGQQTLFDFLK